MGVSDYPEGKTDFHTVLTMKKKPKGNDSRDKNLWYLSKNISVKPKLRARLNRIIVLTGEFFRLLDKFQTKYRIYKNKETEYPISKGIASKFNPALNQFYPGMGRGCFGKFIYVDSDFHVENFIIDPRNYFKVIDHDRCFIPITRSMHEEKKPLPDDSPEVVESYMRWLEIRDQINQSQTHYENFPILTDYIYPMLKTEAIEKVKKVDGLANWQTGSPLNLGALSKSEEFLNEKHFSALKLLSTINIQLNLINYHIEDDHDKNNLHTLLKNQLENLKRICLESTQFQDYFKIYRLESLYLLIYEVLEFYQLNKHYAQQKDDITDVIEKYIAFAEQLNMPFTAEEKEGIYKFATESDSSVRDEKINSYYFKQKMFAYTQVIDEKLMRSEIENYFLTTEEKNYDAGKLLLSLLDGCDLFLMSPLLQADTPNESDLNHLYLYKDEKGIFYRIKEEIHYLDKEIIPLFKDINFDQSENPIPFENPNLCKIVLDITSKRGHTLFSLLKKYGTFGGIAVPYDFQLINYFFEVIFSKEFSNSMAAKNKPIILKNILKDLNKTFILKILIENQDWENMKLFLQEFPDTLLMQEKNDGSCLAAAFKNNFDVSLLPILSAIPDFYKALDGFDDGWSLNYHFLLGRPDIIKALIAEPYINQVSVETLGQIYKLFLEEELFDLAEDLIAKRKDLYVNGQREHMFNLLKLGKPELARRLITDGTNNMLALAAYRVYNEQDGARVKALIECPFIKEFSLVSVIRAFQELIQSRNFDLAIQLFEARKEEFSEAKFPDITKYGKTKGFATTLSGVVNNDHLSAFFAARTQIINQFSPQEIGFAITCALQRKKFSTALQFINNAKEIDMSITLCNVSSDYQIIEVRPIDLVCSTDSVENLKLSHHVLRLSGSKPESKGDSKSSTSERELGEQGFKLVKSLIEKAASSEEHDRLVHELKLLEDQNPFLKTFQDSSPSSIFSKDSCTWGNLMAFCEAQKTKWQTPASAPV